MSSPPPIPCPECKVVLDGDLAEAIFATTCLSIERFLEKGGELQNVGKIIRKLIRAENAAFEFQRAVLEGQGYNGEHGWPLCLMTVDEIKAL